MDHLYELATIEKRPTKVVVLAQEWGSNNSTISSFDEGFTNIRIGAETDKQTTICLSVIL